MNHMSGICRSINKSVHKLEQVFEDRQIDMVNIMFFYLNLKKTKHKSKIKKLTATNNAETSCNVHTGSIRNILPFQIYKLLFPKSAKSCCHEPKVRIVSLQHIIVRKAGS